jgi:hypothetical protein
MKRLLNIALLSTFLFTDQARAEYFTEVCAAGTTNIVQVPTNKVMSKIAYSYYGKMRVEKNGVTTGDLYNGFLINVNSYTDGEQNGSKQTKIAGPATVKFFADSGSSLLLSYEMSDNESVSLSKPSNAVVIPTDAAGPVEIVLESSTDLITWTAAEPGLYGSSSPKRFFRVRAIAQ